MSPMLSPTDRLRQTHELIGRDFLVLLVPPEQGRQCRIHRFCRFLPQVRRLTVVRADGQRIDVGPSALRVARWQGGPAGGRLARRHDTQKPKRNLEKARQTRRRATHTKSAFITQRGATRSGHRSTRSSASPINSSATAAIRGQRERLARGWRRTSLLMILSDILDAIEDRAGKLTLEQQPFSFRQLIDRVSDLVRDNAAHKGLDFRVLTDERLPQVVVGDAMRLSQVPAQPRQQPVKLQTGNVTLWIFITGGPGTAVTFASGSATPVSA